MRDYLKIKVPKERHEHVDSASTVIELVYITPWRQHYTSGCSNWPGFLQPSSSQFVAVKVTQPIIRHRAPRYSKAGPLISVLTLLVAHIPQFISHGATVCARRPSANHLDWFIDPAETIGLLISSRW